MVKGRMVCLIPYSLAQGLLPALGRLLQGGRETGALLEVLEDVAMLGGADLLRGQASAISAALAAGLRAVHDAIATPPPGAAGAALAMRSRWLDGMKATVLELASGQWYLRLYYTLNDAKNPGLGDGER